MIVYNCQTNNGGDCYGYNCQTSNGGESQNTIPFESDCTPISNFFVLKWKLKTCSILHDHKLETFQ